MTKQYSINQNFIIALSVLSLYNCRQKNLVRKYNSSDSGMKLVFKQEQN